MKNCSFQCFVCSHHENFEICVAILMLNTCSFSCMMCTHVGDILGMFPFVSLPNPPLVASRMLTTCSFKCLVCNNPHEFTNEKDTLIYSNFGVLVFPHLEDVQLDFSYIDLACAYLWIYLCCANGVVSNQGHAIVDMLRYHTQNCFAWSLSCVGTNEQTPTSIEHELMERALESYLRKCIHEWFKPHTSTIHDLSMRAHRHVTKVTSFYFGYHARIFELWLLFECCFVSLVLLIGFMRSKGAFK